MSTFSLSRKASFITVCYFLISVNSVPGLFLICEGFILQESAKLCLNEISL